MKILNKCQENNKKSSKKTLEQVSNSKPISNKKFKKQHATSIANNYVKNISTLSNKQVGVLGLLCSMIDRYEGKKLNPSHLWISKAIDCCRNTVITATNKLRDLNLIRKKNRGWDVVNLETNIFKSKTCQYSLDKKMIEDFKFIAKYLPKSHELCQRIMAAIPTFITFWALTFININYNINFTNTKSIRSNNITIFGQYDYDISKISKKLPKTHTTTLPITQVDSICSPEHPANIETDYDYTAIKAVDIYAAWFERTLNEKFINLMHCTDSEYKALSTKEKQIAHAFFNGIKTYKSLENYQTELLRLNKYNLQTYYLLWFLQRGNKAGTLFLNAAGDGMEIKLTESQIANIKYFDEKVLEKVRHDIRTRIDKKSINYDWIIERCTFYKNRLDREKYLSPKKLERQRQEQLEYERSKYPYKPYKPPKKESFSKEQIFTSEINQKFVDLIGEENFIAFSKRCGLL